MCRCLWAKAGKFSPTRFKKRTYEKKYSYGTKVCIAIRCKKEIAVLRKILKARRNHQKEEERGEDDRAVFSEVEDDEGETKENEDRDQVFRIQKLDTPLRRVEHRAVGGTEKLLQVEHGASRRHKQSLHQGDADDPALLPIERNEAEHKRKEEVRNFLRKRLSRDFPPLVEINEKKNHRQ